jgi:GntR family transcriptional regulator
MNEGSKIPDPVRLDSRPLYTQTIEALSRLISEGAYKPGDLLPKESVLSEQLGISRSTLRVALGYLETHGLISRRPGVGTFVAAWIPDHERQGFMGGLDRLETLDVLAEQAGLQAAIVERHVEQVKASAQWAGALALREGDDTIRIRIIETVNGRRGAFFDTVVPASLVDYGDISANNGDVIRYLSHFTDLSPAHTRSEIFAIGADAEIAERLQVDPGQCLLHLVETFYTQGGKAVALSYNYFLTDVFRFYLIRRVQVHP